MEYDVILVMKADRAAIAKLLNDYANAGWEPIHFYDTDSRIGIVLKRPKMLVAKKVGRPPKNEAEKLAD